MRSTKATPAAVRFEAGHPVAANGTPSSVQHRLPLAAARWEGRHVGPGGAIATPMCSLTQNKEVVRELRYYSWQLML